MPVPIVAALDLETVSLDEFNKRLTKKGVLSSTALNRKRYLVLCSAVLSVVVRNYSDENANVYKSIEMNDVELMSFGSVSKNVTKLIKKEEIIVLQKDLNQFRIAMNQFMVAREKREQRRSKVLDPEGARDEEIDENRKRDKKLQKTEWKWRRRWQKM